MQHWENEGIWGDAAIKGKVASWEVLLKAGVLSKRFKEYKHWSKDITHTEKTKSKSTGKTQIYLSDGQKIDSDGVNQITFFFHFTSLVFLSFHLRRVGQN